MSDLHDYREFFEKHASCLKSESVENLFFECEVDSTKCADLSLDIIELEDSKQGFVVNLTITLVFPEQEGSVELRVSQSLARVEVGSVTQTEIGLLRNYEDVSTISRLIRINDTGEDCDPKACFDEIRTDAEKLAHLGFLWRISATLSKDPIADIRRELNRAVGIDPDVAVFLTVEGLTVFLESTGARLLFDRALSGNGSLVVHVGGFHSTITGPHLIITDLWDTEDALKASTRALSTLQLLKEEQSFLLRISSPSFGLTPVVPEFFEIEHGKVPKNIEPLITSLLLLKTFYSLLAISSYVVKSDSEDEWTLRIVGNKTIQSSARLEKRELVIDGHVYDGDLSSFSRLTHWALDDRNAAKVRITRRTAALHCISFKEVLDNAKEIQLSAEAAHDLYIRESVAEVMEIRQRFSEYLLNWSNKDIEHRLKLDNALSLAAIGGFTTLLGSVLGLISQSFDLATVIIVWTFVPFLFLIYLIAMLARIEQINGAFDVYLGQHLRQVKYYKGVLGESGVLAIAGSVEKEELEKDFQRKRKNYHFVIVLLAIITVIIWAPVLSAYLP